MPQSPQPITPAGAPTVRAAVQGLADRFAAAGIAEPTVDAELLIAHVLHISRGAVQAAVVRGDELTDADAAALEPLAIRRAAREPLQHITGLAPFRHLELRVGPGVFVPRPETEIVAQIAIDALLSAAGPEPVAVDLGTGSGAIALALATEVPHARVYAAENSADAFSWTRENFDRVGASNARLSCVDLAHAFPELDGTVSVVVSNPPYVPDDAVPRDPEVRLHDPEAALYGGPDGLDVVRAVSLTALRLAHPGGTLVIEHGEWQGQAIRDLLTADGWRAAATHPDLTLRDRVTTAVRP
ncbi:MAG TPA: peptide chain release factor N(5)-glutamine methyltransferase [Microbacterium sp.]|uniref:peptide chain release factor N(5)-glutamine methyltransferase n=1 Tax=Microbacterium sp. TaxID=51671 RepID=UPI002C3D9F41|nr:peptide chain release factor N(5)-glutamine methyltransferase [Microbacterium sp.]HWI31118.1 peptide chain release factor N(5)-glutamine methyltransferase [Microbacterium sp.]